MEIYNYTHEETEVTTAKKTNALKAAFKKTSKPAATPSANGRPKQESGMVLIGANFPPTVRQTLGYISADTQRNIKSLLGEAINDLAVKYGKPTPYSEEA